MRDQLSRWMIIDVRLAGIGRRSGRLCARACAAWSPSAAPTGSRSRSCSAAPEHRTAADACTGCSAPNTHAGHARRTSARYGSRSASEGLAALEGYPIGTSAPGSTRNLFPGTLAARERAGFVEVARREPDRPIVGHLLE
jgi:hypothetical protein